MRTFLTVSRVLSRLARPAKVETSGGGRNSPGSRDSRATRGGEYYRFGAGPYISSAPLSALPAGISVNLSDARLHAPERAGAMGRDKQRERGGAPAPGRFGDEGNLERKRERARKIARER